jgi:hypothetical protein
MAGDIISARVEEDNEFSPSLALQRTPQTTAAPLNFAR